jgi:hypothetical protein
MERTSKPTAKYLPGREKKENQRLKDSDGENQWRTNERRQQKFCVEHIKPETSRPLRGEVKWEIRYKSGVHN